MKKIFLMILLMIMVTFSQNISYASEMNYLIKNGTGNFDYIYWIFGNNEIYDDGYPVQRNEITSISFLNSIKVPTYAVCSWDASTSKDGSIIAWIVKNEDNSSWYDLYIGSNERIYASSGINLFSGYTNLKKINFNNFDTSQVTSMNYMFADCKNLAKLNLNCFDTSKVTDMSYMFSNNWALANLELGNFNTSNVTNMEAMFSMCWVLTSLDLSNFDTSKVNNMSSMFSACRSIVDLNISNFDTSNVMNMSAMFCECPLKTLDLSHFNTDKVTVMDYMFLSCDSLVSLDLSNFNTSKVYTMDDMFSHCESLKYLYFGSLDTINISKVSIFEWCYSLEEIHIKELYIAFRDTIDFESCSNLKVFTVGKMIRGKKSFQKPHVKDFPVYNGSEQKVVIYGNYPFYMSVSGNYETDVGKYKAIVSLKYPTVYQWEDGTTNDIEIEWEIKKGKVSIPYYNDMIKYNGKKIDFLNYVKNYDSNIIDVVGNEKINAGEYKAVFSLKNTNNYEWIDGTTDDKIIAWEIVKGTVEKYNDLDIVLDYTGSKKNICEFNALKNYMLEYENEIELGGIEAAIFPGKYYCTLKLKNSDNLEWRLYDEENDEYTYTTEDQILEWEIYDKYGEFERINACVYIESLIPQKMYNRKEQEISLAEFSLKNAEFYKEFVETGYISVEGTKAKHIGKHEVTFKINNTNVINELQIRSHDTDAILSSGDEVTIEWEIIENPEIPKREMGDFNNDNIVEITDVRVLLQKVIANTSNDWTEEEKEIGDVNKDETIDIVDVRLLLQKVISEGG